jgi:hypothetical protein
MNGINTYSSASGRTGAIAWVGMAILMSLAVATTNFLNLPLETVYVFAAGVTLREVIGLVTWTINN